MMSDRRPPVMDMDIFEYIHALPLNDMVIKKLEKRIKERDNTIHAHATVRTLVKAQTITKYLGRVHRDIYFQQELEKVRNENIRKKKIKYSDY